MIQVYQDSGFDSFTTNAEFFQTSTMKKHGSFTDIQKIAGGQVGLQKIVNGLQEALYDQRVVA